MHSLDSRKQSSIRQIRVKFASLATREWEQTRERWGGGATLPERVLLVKRFLPVRRIELLWGALIMQFGKYAGQNITYNDVRGRDPSYCNWMRMFQTCLNSAGSVPDV